MKSMKIKVGTDEHGESNLDEIVEELEKIGLLQAYCAEESHTCVCTYKTYFNCYSTDINQFGGELVTLDEFRSMNVETLKGGVRWVK